MSELFGKDNVPRIGRRHVNNDITMIDQNVITLKQFGKCITKN